MAVIGLRTAAVAGLLALTTACGAESQPAPGGAQNNGAQNSAAAKKVVAASSWEAAFAKAAGAKDISVIVPPSVAHGADYDPKPSDLSKVASADLVLYAEFEGFAGKIKDASGSSAKLHQVNLDNSPDVVRAEVRKIAEKIGTTADADTWLSTYDKEITDLQGKVKQAWVGGKPPKVVAQVFVTYAAKLAGADVLGTYGPQPVTPGQLADLTGKKPELVLDNTHMSTGQVMPGAATKQVNIINYPGGDYDLLGVYRTNADEIIKALRA
ncbi:metal ABC transporter solute-binding protein, Zn/Mn family [Kibdelosporangium phytohabitans]|uniref:ABC transporter substrate-binding protein n=1 Tax=Kibdelosporangium phytohabitans TaxID=860235 RepID=A0A0N7F3S1_9PSEU|nr:zinc ABC transporter substrate-binding protein [Kibdelosporangium phytohabitans]ALG09415.1 ABC transporter substrate-binding protein [Kibdelosporangium phytohabitans]MBE1469304.1 zinc transport system substrate-binding protein [Kibdelosporangium phytohabitans]